VKLAKSLGGILGIFVLGGLILLLTRSHPKPEKHPKKDQHPIAAATSAGVQDAFAYAKDLEAKLRAEPKYARVYLVPSAATANQKAGKVVVQGDVATEDDLRALRTVIAQGGVPVTLEWQVSVQQPAEIVSPK
jgi:hypothetical protein